jgi:hypothetical protein
MRSKGPLRPGVLALALLSTLIGPRLGARENPASAPASAMVARRKALFIEQFTRLVEWPPAALPGDAHFVLCIAGASATAEELTKITVFRKFKDRPCDVRRVHEARELGSCHLLYLAASEAARLPQTLAAVAAQPILTVGDTPGFVQRGVQFNLFEETRTAPQPGTYVGFELNAAAVKRSVLVFDPRLLSSGRRVDSAAGGAR